MKFLAVFLLMCGPAYGHDALLGGNAFRSAPMFKTPPQNKPTKQRPVCLNAQSLRDNLQQRFKESLAGAGFNESRGVSIQIYASKFGTFSIVLMSADGTACVMDSGKGWQFFDVLEGPES